MSTTENKKETATKSFATAGAWEKWLAANHARAEEGIWLRIFNKESGHLAEAIQYRSLDREGWAG